MSLCKKIRSGFGTFIKNRQSFTSNSSSPPPLSWSFLNLIVLTSLKLIALVTGAVLSQMRDDDKWHPVAYPSKGLSSAECNYDIYDKEMLAVIHALEAWCHY